ncbi:MAG: ACT domain-containing protein [Candidatus Eisenbacteria bacterium]|uniref:aspartate kinase n=1 Tax=Eiseniibacteriota bacterium TaxID=2212470 RepID=A0A937X9L9_UNCEI|nr:ACT domain-containing protein [Candidatus Eisenbacteria bacterium]
MDRLRVEANKDVSKISVLGVPDRPGIAAEIFGTLGAKGFNVELVVTTGGTRGTADICLAVSRDQAAGVQSLMEEIRRSVSARDIREDPAVALVSITGRNLAKVPGIAGRMFKALSARGVNIDVVSTSLSSVTCMIPHDRTEEAVAALEGEFLAELG